MAPHVAKQMVDVHVAAHDQPIPVVFDLMHPICAGRPNSACASLRRPSSTWLLTSQKLHGGKRARAPEGHHRCCQPSTLR